MIQSAMRDGVFAATMTMDDLLSLRLEPRDLVGGLEYSVQSLVAFATWKAVGRDLRELPPRARTELARHPDGTWSLVVYAS